MSTPREPYPLRRRTAEGRRLYLEGKRTEMVARDASPAELAVFDDLAADLYAQEATEAHAAMALAQAVPIGRGQR